MRASISIYLSTTYNDLDLIPIQPSLYLHKISEFVFYELMGICRRCVLNQITPIR